MSKSTDALQRGPHLQEGPIDSEMVLRDEPSAPRLADHLAKDGHRYLLAQEPLSVLREACGIKDSLGDGQPQEPLEEQGRAQPLAELPL